MSKHDIYLANMGDFFRGLVGGGAVVATAITTAQMDHIEWILRCVLHVSGIVVAGVTAWSIVRRSRKG